MVMGGASHPHDRHAKEQPCLYHPQLLMRCNVNLIENRILSSPGALQAIVNAEDESNGTSNWVGDRVNKANAFSTTALMLAAKAGSADNVKLLLQKGEFASLP